MESEEWRVESGEWRVESDLSNALGILSISAQSFNKCAEAEKTSQGAPSTVCTLKTPNKTPQDVKDKHFSTLCSASW